MELEELEWDYFWENDCLDYANTLSINKSSTNASKASEIGDFFPEFVSKFQDERTKRAVAEEGEKREKLRKLLGLDKMKARDSAETIITPEETLSTASRSSSESSGNICLKDITVSDSQLKLLNIYNIYPVPEDPGLVSGFWVLFPKEISYKEDGIQRFMDLSGKMKLRPIKKVCEMLKIDCMDLGFYGVDSRIIRALCDAITDNTSVQTLNLRENWLTMDACFHLNDLLINNEILSYLNLSGCRIGPRGARRLINGIGRAQSLQYLNVSKCELGDEGAGYICAGVSDSISLKILDLSDNNLLEESALSISNMLTQTQTLEEINLSWNSLKSPEFWKNLLSGILNNSTIKKINLSWNSLEKECLPFLLELLEKSTGITELNLSSNRFDDEDIKKLSKSFSKNSSLQYLSLKDNPIGSEGALSLIKSINPSSHLCHLDLDNIWANKDIIPVLEDIKTKKSSLKIKLGGILSNYQLKGPDPKKIFLKRANFEAMKPKKKRLRRNFGHFVLSLGDSPISKIEFQQLIKRFKLKLTDSLVEEIIKAFGANDEIDQMKFKEFYLREYPDTTPPPPKIEKKKKKKGKKGKKGEEITEIGDEKLKEKKVRMMDFPNGK